MSIIQYVRTVAVVAFPHAHRRCFVVALLSLHYRAFGRMTRRPPGRNRSRRANDVILHSSVTQGIDELPAEMRSLMKMAVDVPPIARAVVSGALAAIGAIVLIGALLCLARAAKRQEKLHLTNPLPSNATAGKTGQLNPAFQNSSSSK